MDKIADYENDGIQFGRVTTVFEIFSSPLPSHIDMDGVLQDVEDANDLFRASIHFGFDELYLPDRETVAAKSGDKDLEFSTVDFVRWQLVRMNSETIYYLIPFPHALSPLYGEYLTVRDAGFPVFRDVSINLALLL